MQNALPESRISELESKSESKVWEDTVLRPHMHRAIPSGDLTRKQAVENGDRRIPPCSAKFTSSRACALPLATSPAASKTFRPPSLGRRSHVRHFRAQVSQGMKSSTLSLATLSTPKPR